VAVVAWLRVELFPHAHAGKDAAVTVITTAAARKPFIDPPPRLASSDYRAIDGPRDGG